MSEAWHQAVVWAILTFSGILFAFVWLIWALRGKRDVRLVASGFGLSINISSVEREENEGTQDERVN